MYFLKNHKSLANTRLFTPSLSEFAAEVKTWFVGWCPGCQMWVRPPSYLTHQPKCLQHQKTPKDIAPFFFKTDVAIQLVVPDEHCRYYLKGDHVASSILNLARPPQIKSPCGWCSVNPAGPLTSLSRPSDLPD